MDDSTGLDDAVSLEDEDLQELAARARELFDVRDRRHGIPPRTYRRCFVGREAVARLVETNVACDERDAIRIGNLLLGAGVFSHVLDEHRFENAYLFYRFASDRDHGRRDRHPDGSVVSWVDLLDPLAPTNGDGGTLQADIPGYDPGLGRFARADLEAVGIAPLDEHNARLLDLTHPKAWVDPDPKERYNLVVVGGGAGGLVTAAAAAGVGARVALVESHLLGGDCLNVGCVPSKALLRCAKAAAAVRGAAELGIKVNGEVEIDFAAIMARMRRLRADIAPHDSAQRFADLGVDVFIGRGEFTGRDRVTVNGKTLVFSKAVVATGGTAAIPPIPGLAEAPYLTNASVFNLTELPPRLGIVGAGPIGVELAQAFQRFGSRVTVLESGAGVLPREDRDAASLVRTALERDGVRFETGVRLERVESGAGGAPVAVVMRLGVERRVLEFDALLVATGRKPAVEGLGLEAAGVDFDERTGISVDDRLRSTNPDVYAVGDVATRYQFTHMADFMARAVVRNALFFGRERFSRLLIPWATYTDPEVAHVGLYEHDLEARGVEFLTFRRELAEVDRSVLDGETGGFVKIHVKRGTDRILGATIVGPHAGEQISEVSVAMQAEMGLGHLANVIHPYPTAAEAIRHCADAYNRSRLTPAVRKIFNRLMAFQRR